MDHQDAYTDTDRAISKAEFNPKVKSYWMLVWAIFLFVTVAGIPLLILLFLLGGWITQKHLSKMKCELTEKFLKVEKGVMTKVEKNIPLDQITDLGMVQGPVMRFFGLKEISVETAGQSGTGALVKLVGIIDVEDFRDSVLKQRDLLIQSRNQIQTVEAQPESENQPVLDDILKTLKKIEAKL